MCMHSFLFTQNFVLVGLGFLNRFETLQLNTSLLKEINPKIITESFSLTRSVSYHRCFPRLRRHPETEGEKIVYTMFTLFLRLGKHLCDEILNISRIVIATSRCKRYDLNSLFVCILSKNFLPIRFIFMCDRHLELVCRQKKKRIFGLCSKQTGRQRRKIKLVMETMTLSLKSGSFVQQHTSHTDAIFLACPKLCLRNWCKQPLSERRDGQGDGKTAVLRWKVCVLIIWQEQTNSCCPVKLYVAFSLFFCHHHRRCYASALQCNYKFRFSYRQRFMGKKPFLSSEFRFVCKNRRFESAQSKRMAWRRKMYVCRSNPNRLKSISCMEFSPFWDCVEKQRPRDRERDRDRCR